MRKHIKGESQLTKLSESIDFICAKFGEYECKRREKDNVISDTKTDVSIMNEKKRSYWKKLTSKSNACVAIAYYDTKNKTAYYQKLLMKK